MHCTRDDKTGGVRVMQLVITLSAQYQQFLDKNVKKYLINCSPGVKHVLRVESGRFQ